ncbi:hypothetical protein [Desulfofundulus sp. TPOSR]|uniref:hypothetical protein n=1 Tax=Desulfofundulus sp. TPOSR TaxID=2714340 RepID=UPI0037BE255F
MRAAHTVQNLKEVADFRVTPHNRLFSADGQEILAGWTTDIYFIKTREILRAMGLAGTEVVAEVFAGKRGVLAGVPEVKNLLAGTGVEVWALPEGEWFGEKEVVLRIHGPYDRFGIYETAILGILASSSGWATAARQCKEAAGNKRVICFGARHVHPAVAPVMERAAVVGGSRRCQLYFRGQTGRSGARGHLAPRCHAHCGRHPGGSPGLPADHACRYAGDCAGGYL